MRNPPNRSSARRHARLQAIAGLLAVLLAPSHAAAQGISCKLSLFPFDFGVYMPGDMTPLDVTGSLDITCTGRSQTVFVVSIGAGGSGTFVQREMRSGAAVMDYNLYLDVGRTIVWGDGTGGSAQSVEAKSVNGRLDYSLPIYGRVAPMQNVAAGIYVDDLVVTVEF